MKHLFPEFEAPGEKNYAKIWNEALFVFDTNVLLNLYRYRTKTRDELLAVLKKLGGRAWIPYQVALEFQKNRLFVISDQNKKFSEVRKTIEATKNTLEKGLQNLQLKDRHALIDPDQLISDVGVVINEFLKGLDRLEGAQQTLTGLDPLKEEIEKIFNSQVGLAPSSQAELDAVYKDAEQRFECGVPPGFRDAEKEDEYRHRGLLYKSKYGDVLVWKQILTYLASNSIKALIFVTDDNKEDWWRKVPTATGPKTIGPRIELIEEAAAEAKVTSILFYRPAIFLQNAKEFLQGNVSQEAIDEVQQVSAERHVKPNREWEVRRDSAKKAIMPWLENSFDKVLPGQGFADWIAVKDDQKHAFDIRAAATDAEYLPIKVKTSLNHVLSKKAHERFSEYTIVFVIADGELSPATKIKLDLVAKSLDLNGVKLLFGAVISTEDGEVFSPQHAIQ